MNTRVRLNRAPFRHIIINLVIIMNISKNGKVSGLKTKSSGSRSQPLTKSQVTAHEKQKTEIKEKKEEDPYQQTNQKVESEFWQDCKESEKDVSNKQARGADDKYLTFNNEENLDGDEDVVKDSPQINIKEKASLENSLIVDGKSSVISQTKMTREEKFKMMLEKYADSSPEKAGLKKGVNAQKRCYLLYEKGKIKNEVSKLINQKNNELREQKELSECTFKPKVNKLNRKNSMGEFEQKGIYDRAINWKKRKNEKLDREKASQLREQESHAYRPQVSNNPNSAIFDPKRNVINDFNSRNFLIRLENARLEEKMKKEILNNGGKNGLGSKWSQRSAANIRSSSQTDLLHHNNSQLDISPSNIGDAIKNLHYELHNFNLENEDMEV